VEDDEGKVGIKECLKIRTSCLIHNDLPSIASWSSSLRGLPTVVYCGHDYAMNFPSLVNQRCLGATSRQCHSLARPLPEGRLTPTRWLGSTLSGTNKTVSTMWCPSSMTRSEQAGEVHATSRLSYSSPLAVPSSRPPSALPSRPLSSPLMIIISSALAGHRLPAWRSSGRFARRSVSFSAARSRGGGVTYLESDQEKEASAP
jgi:hypothetical protein